MNKKKRKIVKDSAYGYFRIDPIPTEEEVEKYYKEEFYAAYKQFNDSSLKVQQEEKEFFNSRWEAICRQCLRYFGRLEDLSVFDIGCGFSQALLYFRVKGMKPSGLEPTREGVEYARSKGLKVHQAGIENFACAGKERFDIVCLINVLEHLRKPAKTLANVKNELLKQKGLLVIDVPNDFNDFQVIANNEYKLKEWWICPPNHINYFSRDTLTNLLEKTGYEVVHEEATFPLELFLMMGDIYVGDPKLGKKCHEKRVRFEHLMRKHKKDDKLTRFYKALAELNLGRQIVIYARPAG